MQCLLKTYEAEKEECRLHQEKRRQSKRSVAAPNNNDANKLEEVKEYIASSGNLEVIRFTPEGRQRTTTIGILLKQ